MSDADRDFEQAIREREPTSYGNARDAPPVEQKIIGGVQLTRYRATARRGVVNS